MAAEHLIGKVLLDKRRFVAGRVKAVHPPGAFVSQYNRKPVESSVIEMESGETFVVKDEADALGGWTVLEDVAEQFFKDSQTAINAITQAILGAAKGAGIERNTAFLVLGRLFQVQGGILVLPVQAETPNEWSEG
jgi:hypothetical protein